MVKKLAFVLAIIALVVVAGATASAATFERNLTVGSTGADVAALQQVLVNGGYLTMPAGVAPGYFGGLTKAAVMAWQKAVSLPSTGYFGPLSRAAIGSAPVASADLCPNGNTMASNCMTAPGTAPAAGTLCPNGNTLASNCASAPGSTVGSADGTDGSVVVSTSPYVSTSQSIKKGDTKDIYAVKFEATSGNVTVNRFDVHFNTKPWLIFSKLVLKDSKGNVIATKTLSSSADATEVTVNSDYLVRFDNVNAVVTTSEDTILVVNATVWSSTDKIPTAGLTVKVQSPSGAIRTVNGKGYTDSLGIGTFVDANANTLTISATGSTGDIYSRIDPTTPDTRNTTVSTTNTTNDQVLGVYGLKIQNQNGQVNSLSVNIANCASTTLCGYSATTLFQNVRLVVDGQTYGANSLSSGGVAAFSNMTINFTQDQWKSLKVIADVLATSTSFTASSTLDLSTVTGSDVNDNTITCVGGNTCSSYGATSDVTTNNVTFVPNGGITISNISVVKGSVTTPTSGTWLAAYPSLSFTVTNNGNNPIYISKTSNTALATTTSSGANASSTVTSTVASGSTTGDTTATYIVNVGATRTFTYNYTMDNTNGTTAAKKLSITQINYGTDSSTGTGLNVNFGLENLYVQVP